MPTVTPGRRFRGRNFESFDHWILGVIFFLAGSVVAIRALSSDNQILRGALALLLFHASAMLIVGFGFKRATKPLAVSWSIFFVGFLCAVTISAAR